jgi:hypothetical protein
MERYVIDDNKIITVTKDCLKPYSACADGYQWFFAKFPQGAEYSIVYKDLHEDKRFTDADWLANKLLLCDQTPVVVANDLLSMDCNRDCINYLVLGGKNDYLQLAASGDYSTASAGKNSAICLAWHDGNRPRFSVAYVGENGIKENTCYKLDSKGNFVEVLA